MEQRPFANRYGPLLVGSALILVLDQYTKFLVRQNLGLYESWPIIEGFFNLTYVLNRGAAFGMLSGVPGAWVGRFFIIVTLAAIPVVVYLYGEVESKNRRLALALIFVCGGAVGNLTDRVAIGPVTDFLDFYVGRYHWPAFNVADSCITIGVGIMVVTWLLPHKGLENGGESGF